MDSNGSTCPGRDKRALSIVEHVCPQCSYSVEMFSDERRRKCPACGHEVERRPKTDCAEWCSAASSCILLHGGGGTSGEE